MRPGFRHPQPSCFLLEFGHRHVVPLGRHRSGAVQLRQPSDGWGAQPTLAVFGMATLLLRKALPGRKLNETHIFLVSVSGIPTHDKSSLKGQNRAYKHVLDTTAVLIQTF